jgi:solute carrier family 45 protein 1/2/4
MAATDRAVNETSPLVGARTTDDADVDSMTFVNGSGNEAPHDMPETKTSWYLFILTLSIGGYAIHLHLDGGK